MTNAESIYKDFWKSFDEILLENGEPFKILYKMSGKVKHWSTINRHHIWKPFMVCVGLSSRKKEMHIDLYIENVNTMIGQMLIANKDNISSEISVPVQWTRGEKQPNTIRMKYSISFACCTYREAIEKALPIIMEFIEVAKKYGCAYFFDF